MPTFEMVCLANSRKRKGRCVAGLRTDGQGWIRPVGSNAEGILHPYHYTLHNNTEAQALDVLRVDCSRACAKPHHPEDWVAQPVSWRLISRPVSAEQIQWLRSHLASGPHLLGCTQDKIAHRVLQARPAAHSLALIAPQKLQWLVKVGVDGERKVRALFELNGAEYNLSLTDPIMEGRLQHLPVGAHSRASARLKDGDDVWLTVSLSEPFAPDGSDEEHCYKLVAAVIVIPHTGKVMAAAGAGSPSAKTSAPNGAASNAGGAQATRTTVDAANAFPANLAGEKSLRVKQFMPDLSAYPDPFAEAESEQAVSTPAPRPGQHNAADTNPPVERTPQPVTVTRQSLSVVPDIIQPVAPPAPQTVPRTSRNDKAPLPQIPPQVNPEVGLKISSELASGEKAAEDAAVKPPTKFDKLRQKVPRAFMRWTPEEDALLLEHTQSGQSIDGIAAQMQRHEGAVRKRLEKFGLIETEAEDDTDATAPAPKPQAPQTPPTKPDVQTPTPPPTESAASSESAASTESAAVIPIGQYSMSEPKVRTLAKEQKASPEPRSKTGTANVIRVVVCGAAGRMGREVVKAVVEADGLHLVAAVDVFSAGSDAGELAGVGKIGVVIESELAPTLARWTPDVLIDFTLPDSVKRNAIVALNHGVSPVIGTTGLSASDLSTLDALAKDKGIGAFIAPNFAIGAVLAMQFAAQAARYLPDVEIIELHHEKKLDSPSGTALLTAQKIAAARHEAGVSPLPAPANTIEKAPGARGARHANTGDIPVHSVRLPGFVAHQEVIFGGQGEILTIRHDSIHRSSFMPGVVLAVRKVRALNGLVIGLENLLS